MSWINLERKRLSLPFSPMKYFEFLQQYQHNFFLFKTNCPWPLIVKTLGLSFPLVNYDWGRPVIKWNCSSMELVKIKQYYLSKGVANRFVDLVENVLAASMCFFDKFSNWLLLPCSTTAGERKQKKTKKTLICSNGASHRIKEQISDLSSPGEII